MSQLPTILRSLRTTQLQLHITQGPPTTPLQPLTTQSLTTSPTITSTECPATPARTTPAWRRLLTPSSPAPPPPSAQECTQTLSPAVRPTESVRMGDTDPTVPALSVPMGLSSTSICSDVRPGTRSTVPRLRLCTLSMLTLSSTPSCPSQSWTSTASPSPLLYTLYLTMPSIPLLLLWPTLTPIMLFILPLFIMPFILLLFIMPFTQLQ